MATTIENKPPKWSSVASAAAVPAVAPADAPLADTPTEAASPAANPSAKPSTTTTAAAATAAPAESTPIHTLVVDTGPLIKNEPPLSALRARAEVLLTTPAVLAEIRDPATRARVDTALLPFLEIRTPRPASLAFIEDFARRTGDSEVLSRTDLQLLALTYEVECERNGGDWRLRCTPTQQRLNGKSPAAAAAAAAEAEAQAGATATAEGEVAAAADAAEEGETVPEAETGQAAESAEEAENVDTETAIDSAVAGLTIEDTQAVAEEDMSAAEDVSAETPPGAPAAEHDDDSGDDSGGEWITPANLKRVQARDGAGTVPVGGAAGPGAGAARMQAALLTTDFAMQNVALRINLNVVGSTGAAGTGEPLARITRVKTWVLRCHGCFAVTRQLARQFCPRCGQATLTRTSCATNAATGEFRVFLKKNYQHNKRGNVYSVPKPVHGSASGKAAAAAKSGATGGGRGGWGAELILSEDQREYAKKSEDQRRATARMRDLMDEDYLPGLLTGYRTGGQQRVRVGAGRNVNAKKRR